MHVILALPSFKNFKHMPILQIEHKVPSFDSWKKAFDSDPINRKQSGTRRYRIYRPSNDPNYVIVDLEFDNIADTEAALSALRKLWNQVEGTVMFGPKTRILDIIETREY
jgi:hypothetical protein